MPISGVRAQRRAWLLSLDAKKPPILQEADGTGSIACAGCRHAPRRMDLGSRASVRYHPVQRGQAGVRLRKKSPNTAEEKGNASHMRQSPALSKNHYISKHCRLLLNSDSWPSHRQTMYRNPCFVPATAGHGRIGRLGQPNGILIRLTRNLMATSDLLPGKLNGVRSNLTPTKYFQNHLFNSIPRGCGGVKPPLLPQGSSSASMLGHPTGNTQAESFRDRFTPPNAASLASRRCARPAATPARLPRAVLPELPGDDEAFHDDAACRKAPAWSGPVAARPSRTSRA